MWCVSHVIGISINAYESCSSLHADIYSILKVISSILKAIWLALNNLEAPSPRIAATKANALKSSCASGS